jgi:hypothetical protein
MDDFTPNIRRTLDDAVDAGESLSFRYLNVLGIVRQARDSNHVIQSRALEADRLKVINSITIIGIIGLFLATNFIWYWQGFKDGRREGYVRGRDLSRQGFWQE